MKDPFDESANHARELIAEAKKLQELIRVKGLVDGNSVLDMKRILCAADEALGLLKDALHVIEKRNGRVRDEVFSVNELVRRQRVVFNLESDVKDIHDFHNGIEMRVEEMKQRNQDQSIANNGASAPFLHQEVAQREECLQQDIVLDRIAYGLQELRETGVNINDELQEQYLILDEVQNDIEGVQSRLSIVNDKVNKLLATLSNRSKMCIILCLALTLLFLSAVVFF